MVSYDFKIIDSSKMARIEVISYYRIFYLPNTFRISSMKRVNMDSRKRTIQTVGISPIAYSTPLNARCSLIFSDLI